METTGAKTVFGAVGHVCADGANTTIVDLDGLKL